MDTTLPTRKKASQLLRWTKVFTSSTATPGRNMTQQPSMATTMTLMLRIQEEAIHRTSIITVTAQTFRSLPSIFSGISISATNRST